MGEDEVGDWMTLIEARTGNGKTFVGCMSRVGNCDRKRQQILIHFVLFFMVQNCSMTCFFFVIII